LLVACLLSPFRSFGAGAPSFEDGTDEATVSLVAPGFEATVNLIVPADYYAANTTLDVTGMASEGDASAYPENVTVSLGGNVIWAFCGTGAGALGRQAVFSDGRPSGSFIFEETGGSGEAFIRLPKEAVVQSAKMELKGMPVLRARELVNFTGEPAGPGWFGFTVSDAGDVNADGFADVTVGYDFSWARLFLGGRVMDSAADLSFTGYHPEIGVPVSSAGDVNADGYDDVIVGHYFIDMFGEMIGRAYILFGGQHVDNDPDVNLTSPISYYDYTTSVSGAGDVNGDGFDDVLWGTNEEYLADPGAGHVYLHYGGKSVQGSPDLAFSEGAQNDSFGWSVSGAGDVNGDGYDDVIAGAYGNDTGGSDAGRAYIFLGGQDMDNVPDVVLTGTATDDNFGKSVSAAGDVNGDGYGDVVVGAYHNDTGGWNAGAAYMFLGGASMDNIPDATLRGTADEMLFGQSVSNAGDLNGDGYGDLVVGSGANSGGYGGRAYLFFGGSAPDGVSDVTLYAGAYGDAFGYSVSGAGDVNADRFDEVIIGAWGNDSGGNAAGRAYIYSLNNPVSDLNISAGSMSIWQQDAYLNDHETVGDFSQALNDFLRAANATATDAFGNAYVDVPLIASAKNEGNLSISGLNITYQYNATVPDFSGPLNAYLVAHQGDQDADGNISVPITISAQCSGRVRLSGLYLMRDLPPVLVQAIGLHELDEDTSDPDLLDLHQYFQDEVDADMALELSVVSATNSSIVGISILGKRYLSADAANGIANDNWTGTVEVVVACSDRWGQKTESNTFTIIVRNVDDPPVITSSPALVAEPGEPYVYDVRGVDGDGDALRYRLVRSPSGMTIDNATGKVQWLPRARGAHEVELAVSDWNSSAGQAFAVTVTNRPPRATSAPPLNVTMGEPYFYNITAEDPNLDAIDYTLMAGPDGMNLQPGGKLVWTPATQGYFAVSLRLGDGLGESFQNFTVTAHPLNRAPVIITLSGPDEKKVKASETLSFSVNASDPDGDELTYEWQDNGVTVGNERNLSRKFSPGKHTLVLLIGDGHFRTTRTFNFTVEPSPKPLAPAPVLAPGHGLGATLILVGVALAGVAIGASTEVGKYRLLLFFLPLYTRISKDMVLDNETRGFIKGFVYADPGIHFNEILRRAKLGNGTAAHHLAMLEREGIISSLSDGYLKRFYPADMKLMDLPLRLKKVERLILETVRESEGLSQREIARILEISESTVNRHARRLAEAGLLRLERRGMMIKCYLGNDGSIGGSSPP
jgi:hypothetical protein